VRDDDDVCVVLPHDNDADAFGGNVTSERAWGDVLGDARSWTAALRCNAHARRVVNGRRMPRLVWQHVVSTYGAAVVGDEMRADEPKCELCMSVKTDTDKSKQKRERRLALFKVRVRRGGGGRGGGVRTVTCVRERRSSNARAVWRDCSTATIQCSLSTAATRASTTSCSTAGWRSGVRL
jgi:hypothetical protein